LAAENDSGDLPFLSGNRILDALPHADAARIAKLSRVVTLERGDRTALEGRVMINVDFPVTALMSVMGLLKSGVTYEVASVGTEGFVEVDAALESNVALRSASCQFPGESVRMSLRDFQHALIWSPAFAFGVRRAVRARIFVAEQTQICNLRHTVPQRLSRWLLVASERLAREEFSVTHEFLATILGVRRAGVTIALAQLQGGGAIEQRRGIIAIRDADRLAENTCECYAECWAAIEESLGPEASPRTQRG
jgi:hypothetical protein